MQLDKDRVVEYLESMASSTLEGVKRVEDGARMMVVTGSTLTTILQGTREARFQAEVMYQAATMLKKGSAS
jgi:hypothetical protein